MKDFVHAEVRDLAAVLGTPALLAASRPKSGALRADILSDTECAELLSRYERDLRELDRDPAPLRAWLDERLSSPLLGRYFEALVGFWITRLFGARKFAQSVVVSRDHRTLGELDFVFEDAEGGTWHWEVAVKFYLLKGAGTRTDEFWGAMTQDRLDKKLSIIFDRQLGMAHSAEGREALAAAGFVAAPRSRLLMKGMLFYPFGSGWRDSSHPPEVSGGHWRGWWATGLPEDGASEAWTVLKRKQWLSPFRADADFVPRSRAEARKHVAEHFAAEVSPVMFAALGRESDGGWREIHRGLVMRPGWPESAVTTDFKN